MIVGDQGFVRERVRIGASSVIGRGSTVGGNVWLTRSLPPNSHITQAQTRAEVFDDGAGI